MKRLLAITESSDMMFSKYEVYSTTQSLYCYPDTNVLRNHLHITEYAELKAAEEEITALKQYALLQSPIRGRFTKTHLCRIHRFLFSDIYSFAGHLRGEQIAKADTWFYPPTMIDQELQKICGLIQQEHYWNKAADDVFIDRLAFVMAELNIIHPFREGNGRSIREFIRELALYNGIVLNWGNVDRETVLHTAIDSVDDYTALIPLLEHCIE